MASQGKKNLLIPGFLGAAVTGQQAPVPGAPVPIIQPGVAIPKGIIPPRPPMPPPSKTHLLINSRFFAIRW